MWPFRAKITVAEMASIVKEALDERPDADRQTKTDWVIAALEKGELTDPNPRHRSKFQRIRAELFRIGVKHSNQQ